MIREGSRVRVMECDDGAGAGAPGAIERIDQRNALGQVLRALVRLDDGGAVYLDALDHRRTRWLQLEVRRG